MGFIDSHILSLMTFLPLLGAAVILCVPKGKDEVVRWIAAVASFLPLLLAVRLWFAYDRTLAGVNVASQFQFVEHYSWIPSINVEYFLGADGISMPMLLLTALLSFLAVIGSFGIDEEGQGVHGPLPPPRDRDDGRLRLPRLLPLLRLLGSDAAADVLPHRRLGRPAEGVRGDQVLPLHPGRLRPDAASCCWPSTSTRRIPRRGATPSTCSTTWPRGPTTRG